jgi:acetyl-CoA synthetase
VVGVPDAIKGQAIVAFAVLRTPAEPDSALQRELIDWVAQALGKSLAPKIVHFVEDIPKTRNAKVMRRVIRAAYLGEPLGNLAALVNPETVEAIQVAQITPFTGVLSLLLGLAPTNQTVSRSAQLRVYRVWRYFYKAL